MKFSRVEETLRSLFRIFLGLLFVLPYLLWLSGSWQWGYVVWPEWGPTLILSFAQACVSTLFSLALGFLMCHGFRVWRLKALAEGFLLLPNVIPPLFFAMSLFSLVTPFFRFPYGLAAVVVSHILLNCGLVAISLNRLLESKCGGLAEAAWVMGASRSRFWRQVAWPLLRGDLAGLALFIFALCLTSFSLPLLLGGGRSATLEVAIYDAIRSEGRWDKALVLAFAQTASVFFLTAILPKPFWPAKEKRANLGLLAVSGLSALVCLPTAVLLCGWGVGLAGVLVAPPLDAVVKAAILPACLGTLALGLAVGLFHFLLFALTVFVSPHARLEKFLNAYLAPSAAITGFSFLLFPGDIAPGLDGGVVQLVLALSLISYPLLYRWLMHSALAALRDQVIVARTLGATWTSIAVDVVGPQAGPALFRASGLAGVWACGDFALSGILLTHSFSGSFSLPLLIGDLVGNYRFAQAALLLLPLAGVSLLVYAFFAKASRYVVG